MMTVAMDASRASQRAAARRLSPRRSTTMPATIGSQTRMESRCACILVLSSAARQEPTEQTCQPDHHPEGVGIEIPALHLPDDAAQPADRCRGAVDQSAVDDALVARLPQAEADSARERRNDLLVDPVEVVLLDEERAQPAEGVRSLVSQRRAPDVARPGRHESRGHQPERCPEEAVEAQLPRSVKLPRHLADDVVARQHEDGMTEVVVEWYGDHRE